MSILTCLHPLCPKEMKRGEECCGPHWFQLPEDTRRQVSRANMANKKDPSRIGALRVEIVEYFRSRLIGRHEIVTCRGRAPYYANGCGKDIVWLPTARGKKMPVDVAGVEAEDKFYQHGKHTSHFSTCPNAGEFKR